MKHKFIVIGDTHGNFKYIYNYIKNMDIRDTTFLHVGDWGVGFASVGYEKAEMKKLNQILEELNCQMYIIRGNHDDPLIFDGTWKWSNLHLVPDYTVVNVDGDDILMVGGAISVDRIYRKQRTLKAAQYGSSKKEYWYDEVFILNKEKLKEIKGIRYVVTHSCPHFAEPVNNEKNMQFSHGALIESFVDDGDTNLKDELNEERRLLTVMYAILKENNHIEKWFYGHFHRTHAAYYEDTDFIMLGINEFRKIN
jgi:UDP-2,3-diacylglucosamine pyrophosphatase LpxH